MENVSKRAELGLEGNSFWTSTVFDEQKARWYALSTRSNCEVKISAHLESKAVQHFLPGVVERRQWKDRKKKIFTPLFPGYLFTRIADLDRDRLNVLTIPGAVRFLSLGSDPEPVPDDEIEAVRQLLSTGLPYSFHPFLKDGCWVRVRRGPLMGVEGQLLRHRNSSRLVINIDLLSRSIATELDASDVEVINSPAYLQRVGRV